MICAMTTFPKCKTLISVQVCLAKDPERNLWHVKGWSQRSQAQENFIPSRHAQALPRGCVQGNKREAGKKSGKIKPKHQKYGYAWMHFCHISTFININSLPSPFWDHFTRNKCNHTLSVIFRSWDAGTHRVNTSELGARMEFGLKRDRDCWGSHSGDRPIFFLNCSPDTQGQIIPFQPFFLWNLSLLSKDVTCVC